MNHIIEVNSENWYYHGYPVRESTYHNYKSQEIKGICPLCHRTGLTDKYGSKKKHIKTCLKIAKV